MQKVLLDTNAYSELLRKPASIQPILEHAQRVYISVISIGKLLAGFRMGNQEQKNRQILTTFLQKPTVQSAPITATTSEIYSQLFIDLKKAGTPIPLNDIWIAANCIEHGSTLLTYDKHFLQVSGLMVWPELRVK